MKNNGIRVVILCGGRGYRLKEETEFKPKPMVEVGGQPILVHIMNIYRHFEFNDFVIALGYKGKLIKDYFLNKKYYDGDFTINSATGRTKHHSKNHKENFKITFVDTGVDSLTGERVRRIQKYIKSEIFMVTYGDGLANIDLRSLLRFHKSKNVIATATGVYPRLRYGGFDKNKNGLATAYEMKTTLKQMINGGFMVFDRKIFKFIKPDTMIEEVFEPLIKLKKAAVYEHKDFWHAMDTVQDMDELNAMWENDPAWKVW